MSDLNAGLRLAVDRLREQHEDWDIQEQVRQHAQVAMTVAPMERRPPGYSIEEWAVHLMDLEPAALRDRLRQRASVEEAKLAGLAPGDRIFHESVLPALPANAPHPVQVKMLDLHRKWTIDLVRRVCERRLAQFLSKGRDAKVLRAAGAEVQRVLADVSQRVGPVPVKAKLTMEKDGSFRLTLVEQTP